MAQASVVMSSTLAAAAAMVVKRMMESLNLVFRGLVWLVVHGPSRARRSEGRTQWAHPKAVSAVTCASACFHSCTDANTLRQCTHW